MHDNFIAALRKYVFLEEAISQDIASRFKPLHAAKHEILLKKGDICTVFYFVVKGCLRTYYVQKNWQESTRLIALEGAFINVLPSFINQEPSQEYLQALDESELLYIEKEDFDALLDKYYLFSKLYLKLLEETHFEQIKRMEGLINMTAKNRYELLINSSSEIIARVSNRIVATYLGITQESLSRLKAKKY